MGPRPSARRSISAMSPAVVVLPFVPTTRIVERELAGEGRQDLLARPVRRPGPARPFRDGWSGRPTRPREVCEPRSPPVDGSCPARTRTAARPARRGPAVSGALWGSGASIIDTQTSVARPECHLKPDGNLIVDFQAASDADRMRPPSQSLQDRRRASGMGASPNPATHRWRPRSGLAGHGNWRTTAAHPDRRGRGRHLQRGQKGVGGGWARRRQYGRRRPSRAPRVGGVVCLRPRDPRRHPARARRLRRVPPRCASPRIAGDDPDAHGTRRRAGPDRRARTAARTTTLPSRSAWTSCAPASGPWSAPAGGSRRAARGRRSGPRSCDAGGLASRAGDPPDRARVRAARALGATSGPDLHSRSVDRCPLGR